MFDRKCEQYYIDMGALRSAVIMSRPSECTYCDFYPTTGIIVYDLFSYLFYCIVIAHILEYLILIGKSDIFV